VVGADSPQANLENPLEGVIAACRDVAGRTEDYHVNLLLEFNWFPMVKSFRTVVEVLSRCGAENVGVLFDSAQQRGSFGR
jgi:sugar phosphate isomerase/epimerase